jgi:hypothetical protein
MVKLLWVNVFEKRVHVFGKWLNIFAYNFQEWTNMPISKVTVSMLRSIENFLWNNTFSLESNGG